MNIALIGYGKMGQAIERLSAARGHVIVARITEGNFSIEQLLSAKPDIAIEFTQPDVAFENCSRLLHANIPVLCGTTGWMEKMNEIKDLCQAQNSTFIHANNFSIGVNIFFKLNKMLAKLMSKQGQYEASMREVHHIHKKDAPSGTAIQLANDILSNIKHMHSWKLQHDATGDRGELIIDDVREGETPGTHSIYYNSEQDTIELTHTAKTRDAFAIGAVMVAEWLVHQQGFKTMNDYLGW